MIMDASIVCRIEALERSVTAMADRITIAERGASTGGGTRDPDADATNCLSLSATGIHESASTTPEWLRSAAVAVESPQTKPVHVPPDAVAGALRPTLPLLSKKRSDVFGRRVSGTPW